MDGTSSSPSSVAAQSSVSFSYSVSGVVARQNMIYLMERKRQELFAQFVGKLCIKTLQAKHPTIIWSLDPSSWLLGNWRVCC
ncbi:hypothetical protein OIU84_010394 [Salix udensis]|uniref:Uncharacterized protein n=1 Tax=Salix udensis TaxID=889485 RepID=A0AAD6NVG5_9ROSI|nr:hypothetical protein OIU84_010394 [Salix udensis]